MEIHVGDIDSPEKPSKTEILFVSKPPKSYTDPPSFDNTDPSYIKIGNRHFFPVVEKLCYLGTFLTRDCKDFYYVKNRIKKAGKEFARENLVLYVHHCSRVNQI